MFDNGNVDNANGLGQALKRLQQSLNSRYGDRQETLPGHDRSAEAAHQTPADRTPPPLFSAASVDRRAYLTDCLLTLPNGRQVSYRGEQLCQDDHAVWLWLLAQVSCQSGERIEFSPRGALKAMGWGSSNVDQARLRHCLDRMQATLLRPAGRRHGSVVGLSLIEKCEWRPTPGGRSGRWRLWLTAEIQALFADLN